MNNIAILDNPYSEGVVISTNGVGVSSKAAKLNDDKKSFTVTKKDRLVANWEKGKPAVTEAPPMEITSEPKDYSDLLSKVGITPVNYGQETENNGAKKLRVNQIVIGKASNIYNSSNKVDVPALPEEKKEETPVVEEVKEDKPKDNVVSMEAFKNSRSDIHGRHGYTGEIPVDDIKEAVRTNNPNLSRVGRSNIADFPTKEEPRQESNAVDMDLYTSLMSSGQEEDVSKQLQGAKKELSIEKAESRKIAEQYGEAVKELEQLKKEVASKKKIKEQRDKQELSDTLNELESVKRERLERTSDLSSIREEISRLEAQRQALEDDSIYDDYRSSYGRGAA